METVHQENQLTHDDSQSRSEQQQLESRAKRVISNFNRPRSSSQVGMLDSRQQSATDTDFDKVNRRLEEFVGYFVKDFEAKLHAYHMIQEGEVKKSGKFSDTFSGIIGQGVGAAAGGLVGLLLGSPVSGAKLGAKAGEVSGKKLGSKIGDKKHKKKITNLLGLVDFSQKDKANFRRELVEAGFDVFQSFEMQFMRVTTDQGTKKAIQQLAKDATNRAIDFAEKKDASITEGVIFGKSKREGVSSISPGFEIKYEYLSNKRIWSTRNLYDMVGVLVTQKNKPFYHKKKSGSDTGKYGYRRLLISENWEKLKEHYEPDNIVESKSIQFTDYIYIVDQKDLKQKVEDILREINLDDKDLEEERMKKILEEVKDDIMNEVIALKRQSHQYTEDRKILVNIEANLKNLKIDEYLRKFKQDFEEVKQGQQKIVKSIEIGQEENRENFNQFSQKQDIHHDNNKREHTKTQEGVEEVVEVVKDNHKKINEIHEVVVTQNSKQTKEPIWFDVKDPVELFTGREEELDNLHIVLGRSQGRNNPTVISQMTSISGLGGIGKTELARQYIHEHSNDYDNNVIWVNAESEEILTKSFHRLAQDKLRISTKNADGSEKDIRSIMEEVYKFFNKRKSLFIFDNAEKSEYFNKFLPLRSLAHDANKPYVLITSRNREWEKGMEVMDLNELKLEDAIEFVKKGLSIKDESQDQEIKNLVEKLQRFPLAIQQAIAYIEDQRVTGELGINDYLKEYEQKTKDLLNSEVFRGIDNDYAKTTFTTWKITIDVIASDKEHGELALKVLNTIAYFAPENINREMFLDLAGSDENKLKSAVRLLVKYSMTSGVQKQSILSIHRLVQEVTRLSLKEQKKEENILKEVLELMKISSEISSDHAASAWNYVSKYDKLINKFLKSTYGHSLDTPLHLLAKNGNYEAIKPILKINRSIINAEDNYGRTPLYEAAEKGHIEIVKLLVRNGAKIHVNNAYASSWRATGWTVLHGAVYGGNADVVKFLMNEDANICAKDSMGRTPLYIAINEGYEDIIKLLDPTNEMILFVAASLGKLKKVENLLQDKSKEEKRRMTNPEQQRMRGPLHVAANKGYIEIVKLLVENGADINNSADDGYTPLHMAASEDHQDVVEFLVEYVIKKNNKFDILKVSDKSGWTVLHSAAKSGCTEVLKYFIEKFEKYKSVEDLINAADTKGTTLLQTAAFHNKLGTVEFLISKNADINAVDIFGATPLFAASIQNNLDVVKCLLKQEKVRINCDLEKVLGMLNITPLHAAALYDNLDMTELLVKRSNVNAGKESSLTPLHVAAFFDSSKLIKYLVDNGACTDSEVNFSNIARVLNFVKDDLKGGYGSEFINYIGKSLNLFLKIPLVDNFVLSQFTPRMISTILNHNNELVHRDVDGKPVRSMRSRLISSLLTLPQIKKQLKMIKDYVQKKTEDKEQPPIGEDSIFYGIANIKPFTQDNKK